MDSPSRLSISRMRTASRRISGPMPSPASSAIFNPLSLGRGPGRGSSLEDPGLRFLPPLLVRLDLVRMLHCQPDLIPAVHEVRLARGIDFELHRLLAGRR